MQPKEQCNIDFALVGKRFKDERELNKITREYLAEKTGYGVRHIQEVERGDQMPEADFALMCCKLDHRDLNYFYLDDETLLRNLKLLDGKYLTRAAALLFHPEPELFATGAYIKIGYFAKVVAFGDSEEVIEDLQYQDVVEGPLILQVDKSIDTIFTKYFRGLVDYEGVIALTTCPPNALITCP